MTTLVQHLSQVLRSCGTTFNRNDQIAPAAILWTDGEREWEPLLPRLRQDLPQLFTLGNYDPATRTGPAIYLKTVIAGPLPDQYRPDGVTVPILYLPGIARQGLKAEEACPPALQPLAELLFRGTLFLQRGGNDWTVNALLVNPETGLGLEVAKDAATQTALHLALTRVAEVPISDLRGRRLEASDFQALVHRDPDHHLLLWLADPQTRRSAWVGNDWALFAAQAKQTYGINPDAQDGHLEGCRRLGQATGPWAQVWMRYKTAPRVYPGIPAALKRIQVPRTMLPDEHWPQHNADEEQDLRQKLTEAASLAPHRSCTLLQALEQQHGCRRSWVWASLGLSPLAQALEHLATIARLIPGDWGGADLDAVMAAYRASGWRVDAAVTKAIQVVRTDEDQHLISTVVASIYPDWLERVNALFATHFQVCPQRPEAVPAAPGRCILFADGLRFDVGQALADALQDGGLLVDRGWSFAALPTVTATAKPAQAPIASALTGGATGADFAPLITATGKSLTSDAFKRLLADHQIQVLASDQTGDPAGCAWTEHGTLDKAGHDEEIRLCRRIPEEIASLQERIATLLAAGWQEVVVTTDHGWMLVPGGLPKRDLPAYLTITRWSRAAVVAPGTDLGTWAGPVTPWTWNPSVAIAMAPGCHSFIDGKAYAHGGLSLQECVLPRLTVRRAATTGAVVRIGACTWRGLRAVVRIQGAPVGSIAFIRAKAGDPSSSLTQQGVPITSDPADIRLLVESDDAIGQSAAMVVCGPDGHLLAKRPITIQENDEP